jgi:site-specific recombinase XerD
MLDKKVLVEKFLQSKKLGGVSPLTIKRHSDNLKYFFRWKKRKRLNRRNLERFVEYYQKGHKPATVNSAIITLKCFCKFLFERKIIDREIHFYLKTMRDLPFSPLILTLYQVDEIINCPRKWSKYHSWIDRRKYDIFFEFIGRCGLRRNEVLDLRVGDIDFSRDVFRVVGKGNKVRTLPIPQIMRHRLYKWVSERKLKRDDFVFQNSQGERSSAAAFSDELKKRLEILGLDKSIHLHTFRHTFITEAIKANQNTTKVMQACGHSNIYTHMKYVHLVGEDLRDIIDDHPINRLPETRELPERPKLPQFLVENTDYRVN